MIRQRPIKELPPEPRPKKERERKPRDDSEVMTINVNPEWRLQYDGLQWQVQEARVVQSEKSSRRGEVQWRTRAYIKDLDLAIVWLSRHRIWTVPGEYEVEALEKLCTILDQVQAEAVKAMEGGAILVLTRLDAAVRALSKYNDGYEPPEALRVELDQALSAAQAFRRQR